MRDVPEKLVRPRGDPMSNRARAERFVELVRGMPALCSVLFHTRGYSPRIWTVLGSSPFEQDVRAAVYDAEMAAMDAVPDALVGFRLINLAEFENAQPEELLPCDAEILWQRSP